MEWKLEDIYDFKKTDSIIAEIRQKVESFEAKRPSLTEDIKEADFLSLITNLEDIAKLGAKLHAYAELWLSVDTNDPVRNAHASKMDNALADFENRTIYFSLWFKTLSEKNAKRLIACSSRNRYMLESIRKFKPYALTEKEETIVNLKDITGEDTVNNLYSIMTNNFKWKFLGKTMNQSEITSYYQNSNRTYRKNAYKLVLEKYGKEEMMLSEMYRAVVTDWHNENIKIRGFKTPISVMNLGNDLTENCVASLLESIQEHTQIFKDYFKLKYELLKINDPARYDLYAPFQKKDMHFSYEEAKEMCLSTYSEFSKTMGDAANEVFDAKHIDYSIQKGKRSGAFCYSVTNEIVPYVLLNFMGKEEDLFTMMHELGHSIHSTLSKNNSFFAYHASLPLAETASIFGEMLLMKKMLEKSKKDERITLLMGSLDKQYASIIRQGFFVIFEKRAHEAMLRSATVDELNNIYMDTLKEQFSPVISIPEHFKHEWKYIPHIFHTPFYCYSYAFGNLLVLALMAQYEKEGKSFEQKMVKILSYGGSENPTKILLEAGIDIEKKSFWDSGFDIIEKEIKELRNLFD